MVVHAADIRCRTLPSSSLPFTSEQTVHHTLATRSNLWMSTSSTRTRCFASKPQRGFGGVEGHAVSRWFGLWLAKCLVLSHDARTMIPQIMEEFFQQGDVERFSNLEVCPCAHAALECGRRAIRACVPSGVADVRPREHLHRPVAGEGMSCPPLYEYFERFPLR